MALPFHSTDHQDISSLARSLPQGQHKKPCPLCQHERKRHAHDKPLSITVDGDGYAYHCWHCNASGGKAPTTGKRMHMTTTQQAKPVILATPADDIRSQAISYLVSRGITEDVARVHTVQGTYRFNGTATTAIGFPYKGKDGNRINAVKWRSADNTKQFSQQNTCEDFYLLDTYVSGQDILICEGEIDALAWLSSGVLKDKNTCVLSIPNGAPAEVSGRVDPKHDHKFRYVARAADQLSAARRVYINSDNDAPGKALTEELSRRVGKDKVWLVDLDPYKDAAEAISLDGPLVLENALHEAKPIPMHGLYVGQDFEEQFVGLYEMGKPRGAPTGITSLDKLMSIPPGMLTIVTGYPMSGKSDLIDQIALNLAQSYGWRTTYCSFEKPTELHMAQLAEKLVGKRFFVDPVYERMTPGERDWAITWITKHFSFMDYRHGGPSDIDGILRVASASVLRMGTRMLVIDPYNYIETGVGRSGQAETSVISDILTKVQQWAKSHDCHVMFVAHPRLSLDGGSTVPTGHHISGSAAWFAKADIGLTVSRDPASRSQKAHVWKMKWAWMGDLGSTELAFDPKSSRWSSVGSDDDPFDWSF